MFTGIITHLGKLKSKNGSLFTFEVDNAFLKRLEPGTSISINGACMTVTELRDDESFSVDIMPESQKRTMLGSLKKNDEVNLELPATPDTFLSGHIVQGHVDGVGKIVSVREEGISHILKISASKDLLKYIVAKGSIAINGISLTVISVDESSFSVGIIPFTWEHTMLYAIRVEDVVNIETDVFAKYTEKLLQKEGI